MNIAIIVVDKLEPSTLATIEVPMCKDILQTLVVWIEVIMNPIEMVPLNL